MTDPSIAISGTSPYVVYGLFFVYGLFIGSFLNVCIYRIPLGRTVVKGRSYCPSCGALIPWYLNIPVLSYLLLRGRCNDCGAPISFIYPAIELLNAVCYLLVFWVYGLTVGAVLLAALFSILIIIAFIDLRHQIIPDGLVLMILALGILYAVLQTVSGSHPWHFGVLGFFAASLPLYAAGLIYKDGIGGGDIKLMAAAGLFAGWKLILLALFMGAVYALIVAIYLLASKKGTLKTKVPFGPYLAAGIATSLLFGADLINFYLSLL